MSKFLLSLLALTLLPACTTSPTGRTQFMLVSPESAIVESRKAPRGRTGGIDTADAAAQPAGDAGGGASG